MSDEILRIDVPEGYRIVPADAMDRLVMVQDRAQRLVDAIRHQRQAGHPVSPHVAFVVAELREALDGKGGARTMVDSQTCQWPMGTAFTGPRACGNPAKAELIATQRIWSLSSGDRIAVCGIHRRSGLHSWPFEEAADA